ncbi:MAG: hypothetical protein O3B02_04475 [Proteobacteria bacterium]|nr:hypothetical protein [Pseudomonadota bacterium]MDA0896863.1 hypothetical protein [Pseudomonadota bacterium]MDA1244243.1 hypothetical protein [Pseudomonadota bacterium]
MTLKTEQYFDEKAFSSLLKSDDASLLYPLFERALDSLTRFVKEPIKDYSLLEFETHTLKTTCNQLGVKRLANVLSALEKAAAQDDANRCDALKRLINSEFAQVEGALKSHAEELKQMAQPRS